MPIPSIFNQKFRLLFLVVFLFELVSLGGYLWPIINTIGFFFIIAAAIVLSLYRPEYGLYLVLTELFIGSKGYLFYFADSGIAISLRIALWLVVLSLWLARTVTRTIKERKWPRTEFLRSELFFFFLIFFIFLGWGLLNGYWQRNNSANIFFDFNNWLYFLLIFPFYDMVLGDKTKTGGILNNIIIIFLVSVSWLSLKTLILLFIFSHNYSGLVYEIYRWVRESGIGEITLIQGGFYRIFFQSHIYLLPAFYLMLLWIGRLWPERRQLKKSALAGLFSLLIIFLCVNLITFSRSNWFGMIFGLFVYGFYLVIKKKWRTLLFTFSLTAVALLASLFMIIAIVKFPWPRPIGGFDAASLLSERAGQITGEAGAASRWALLPKLATAIKSHPIMGSGFGKTVTYYTADPKIIENNPSGEYTTYAFEWGWLDIWLKLGIFGLVFYILLLSLLLFKSAKLYFLNSAENLVPGSLALGLIGICAVNTFSPYLNHPLGIGLIILAALFIDAKMPIKTGLA